MPAEAEDNTSPNNEAARHLAASAGARASRAGADTTTSGTAEGAANDGAGVSPMDVFRADTTDSPLSLASVVNELQAGHITIISGGEAIDTWHPTITVSILALPSAETKEGLAGLVTGNV